MPPKLNPGLNKFAALANNEFGSTGTPDTASSAFGKILDMIPVGQQHFDAVKNQKVEPEVLIETDDFDFGDDDEDNVEANPVIENQLKILEAKAAENGQILPKTRKATLIKRVPEHLQFQETHPAYGIIPEIITKRYDGKDSGTNAGHQAGKKNLKPGAIFLSYTNEDDSKMVREFGAGFEQIDTRIATPLIRTRVNDNTQYASVSVLISTGRGLANIEARIYGSKLNIDNVNAFEFNVGLQRNMDYYILGSPLANFARAGQVIQKIFRLDPNVVSVNWVGITHKEISDLNDKLISGLPCTDWEMAVNAISNAHEIAITTFPDSRDTVDKTTKFAEYFKACMDTSRTYGDFWFLSFADTTVALKDRQFTFQGHEWEPPRWLVTHWWPVFDEAGKMVRAIPVKWNGYGDVTVWPTPETGILAWRMSLGRARDTKTATLSKALDKQAGIILAQFIANDKEPGSYRVDIWCSLTSPSVNSDDMRPEPMTIVELQCIKDQQFSPIQYKGIVVPKMWKSTATFSVYVKGKPDLTLNGEFRKIKIKVTSLEIAIARQDAAMRQTLELIKDVERDGPDVGNFALGCEPHGSEKNPWTKGLGEAQKRDIIDICKNDMLNVEQMQFVEEFLNNKSGVSTLIGPPGTGKSQVIVAIVKAFNITNKVHRPNDPRYKVLVAAPCNYAIDQLCLRTTTDNVDKDGKKVMNIVRFIGGAKTRTKAEDHVMIDTRDAEESDAEENEKEVDAEAMSIAYFELSERWMQNRQRVDELAEYYSDAQFKAFVLETFQTSKDKRFRDVAKKWGQAEAALRRQETRGKEREKARETKLDMEEILLPLFWNFIDVAFCTLNSAAHDKIRPFFKATLIIIDESGMASVPDKLTAIVPSSKSLQHMILAGDPKQQRPTVIGRDQNEFCKLQDQSVLEQIKNGQLKQRGLDYVQLKRQYRSIPEIADMWAALSYEKDGLTNDESVLTPKPLMETFKKLFRGLGEKHYSDWACFAVAVSDPEAHSKKWNGTMSQFNEDEANLVVSTIHRLITEEPAENCPRVQLQDIMVLTPYQGQMSHIQCLVAAQGWTQDTSNCVRVESTGKIQGESSPIVIMSLCTNKPTDPTNAKFIGDGHTLNVAISRPQSGLIIFGNFLPWIEAVRTDSGYFGKQGLGVFGNLVQYLHPKQANKQRKVVSEAHLRALLDRRAIKEEQTFGELIKLAQGMDLGGRRPKRAADSDPMGSMMPRTKDRGKVRARGQAMAFLKDVELPAEDAERCAKEIDIMLARIRSYEVFDLQHLHKEWEIIVKANWTPAILNNLRRAAEEEFMNSARAPIVDPALIHIPTKPGEQEEIDHGADVDMDEVTVVPKATLPPAPPGM